MISISRWYRDDCTLGILELEGFRCFTLELPYNGNKPNVSCIPPGMYKAFKRKSPANGPCIQLQGVPDRSYIQIHSGNFTHDILGCMLVGSSITFLDDDPVPDVSNSGATLAKILEISPQDVDIEIHSLNNGV